MNWKEFFKPTWKKTIIFFILFFTSLLIALLTTSLVGAPLQFFYEKLCIGIPNCGYRLNWTYLIIDLLFWYVLSCFIVYIHEKFRGRKK